MAGEKGVKEFEEILISTLASIKKNVKAVISTAIWIEKPISCSVDGLVSLLEINAYLHPGKFVRYLLVH